MKLMIKLTIIKFCVKITNANHQWILNLYQKILLNLIKILILLRVKCNITSLILIIKFFNNQSKEEIYLILLTIITTHKMIFKNVRLNSKSINLLVSICYFKINKKFLIAHSNNLIKTQYRLILSVKGNYLMKGNNEIIMDCIRNKKTKISKLPPDFLATAYKTMSHIDLHLKWMIIKLICLCKSNPYSIIKVVVKTDKIKNKRVLIKKYWIKNKSKEKMQPQTLKSINKQV